MKRLLTACLLSLTVSSCIVGKNEYAPPLASAARRQALAPPRFKSEQRWGSRAENRWEPVVAADPSLELGLPDDDRSVAGFTDLSSFTGRRTHVASDAPHLPARNASAVSIRSADRGKQQRRVDVICLNGFRPGVVFTQSRDHGRSWSRTVRLDAPLRYSDKPTLVLSSSGKDVYVAFSGGDGALRRILTRRRRELAAAGQGDERASLVLPVQRNGRAAMVRSGSPSTAKPVTIRRATVMSSWLRPATVARPGGRFRSPSVTKVRGAAVTSVTPTSSPLKMRSLSIAAARTSSSLQRTRANRVLTRSTKAALGTACIGASLRPLIPLAIIPAPPSRRGRSRAIFVWSGKIIATVRTLGTPGTPKAPTPALRGATRSASPIAPRAKSIKEEPVTTFRSAITSALAVDSRGVDHVIWGEGAGVYYPGSTWWTRD